ncbi:MAG TPA: hypothetical protein VG055_20485 [Planctomycetaceae bacterium]|jgi:hypothetical protein|nr:hypothetical protein [Planctomycetaceae bacterium]
MELDELKTRWQEQDKKLDECIRLNQRVLQESLLNKAETALKRLSRLLWFELLLNVAGAIAVGSFIGDHFQAPRFLVPALAIQLGFIALIIGAGRQLAAIARVDYAAPIVTIQKRLESLRIERIHTVQWTLILSPLAWMPLFIVAMLGLFGVDVYTAFPSAWLVANVVFGLAVIVIAVWVSRSYGDRLGRWPSIQRLLQYLGGQNLAVARGIVQSLSRYADDQPNGRPED